MPDQDQNTEKVLKNSFFNLPTIITIGTVFIAIGGYITQQKVHDAAFQEFKKEVTLELEKNTIKNKEQDAAINDQEERIDNIEEYRSWEDGKSHREFNSR